MTSPYHWHEPTQAIVLCLDVQSIENECLYICADELMFATFAKSTFPSYTVGPHWIIAELAVVWSMINWLTENKSAAILIID